VTGATPTTSGDTRTISNSTAYKYIAIVITSVHNWTQYTRISNIEYYGTQEDTETPLIVGGPFAGKVANFRVYDQYLGDERIQEIYDAQKDEFGHKKSSMTFYKGRIGVGTTEPEGALTVVDEPNAVAKFPARAVSADDSYDEGIGQIKLSAADGTGYQAFDGLTSTSWDSTPTRNTRVSEEVDFGAWLKIQTPESMSLKKAEFESNPYWNQVGSETYGGSIDNTTSGDHFGRAVACSHDGTRVIVGAYVHSTDQGKVKVYDWNGSSWTLVGSTLTGVADQDRFGYTVAISGDGNIIAVTAPYEHSNGSDSGTVRVYYLVGSTWTILPDSGSLTETETGLVDTFVGSAANMYLGLGSLQLSYDGKTIAMLEYGYDISGKNDVGRVLVYKYSNGAWSYKGTGATQFVGDTADSHFGFGMGMSEDSDHLVLGTLDAGHFVEVYKWDGSSWGIKGARISQPGSGNEYFGPAVSISNDGNTMAVGIKNADVAEGAPAENAGVVYVYHWSGSAWGTPHQLTQPVTDDDDFGDHLVMSGDGKRIIVGASHADDGGTNSGRLYTFEYTGVSWVRREVPSIGADGGTTAYLGMGPSNSAHSIAISRDGSVIVAGESGFYTNGAAYSGRVRIYNMPSNIKSIWGSNDDVNWTKITTAPTREEATSNVAGLAFGYDDRLEFKNLDNPNYYKYHAIVADAFTQLKDIKLFGIRNQGSSTLHDGTLTLTKNLDVPRIGPPLDADDTPQRDRLVVEYNTSTNPLEDGLVQDTSGRGNDACMKGATSYSSAMKAFDIAGTPNGSSAPSTSAYLEVGQRLPFKGNQAHTVSLWFNKQTSSQDQNLFGMWKEGTNYGTPGHHSGVLLLSTGKLQFWHWSGDIAYTDPIGDSSTGWRHLVTVYNGTVANQKLYVNGIEAVVSSTSGSGNAIDITNAKMTMGQDYFRGNYYYQADTQFSGIKVYDTALTAEEAKTLYDMGRCSNAIPKTLHIMGGMMRYNNDINRLQIHNGVAWLTIGGVSATGGTVTNADGYTIHTFTDSGTFTVNAGGDMEYLVVAGGGGGSNTPYCGGGGAGGMLTGTLATVSPGTYTITRGGGGATGTNGSVGSDSQFNTIIANGGGGGGGMNSNGLNGGSGGGGGYLGGSTAGNGRPGGTGVAGQGNNGGQGNGVNGYGWGGGGGGAGAAGTTAKAPSPLVPGDGGDGLQSSITGTATYYAGGAGGRIDSANSASGGLGGGGSGGPGTNADGTAGGTNTGGGGGPSKSGGSGIVIIRYLS
jgi:hypothetical protein